MIIVNAPLRVSFFGGGSDLPAYYLNSNIPGMVLSTTISRSLKIVINPTNNENIRVLYSKIEDVDSLDKLKHDRVKACLSIVGINKGIEIASFSDVSTRGSGLGSSSAYTAGLLKGLALLKGIELTRHELAALTCTVEIDNCNEPIGKQDQYASVFGGFNRITFGAQSVEVSPINIKSTTYEALQRNLLMFDTGFSRKTADILKKIEPTEAWLGNTSTIRDFVFQGEAMLRDGDIDSFGRLMDKAWHAKRRMAPGVSNLLYNMIYDRAYGAGALGGKLLGAGGGGSFLFYVPADKVNHREFIAHMETDKMKHREFHFTDEGTKVIYNTM